MVSARPPPHPIRGRISYPTASTYVPGDIDASPGYVDNAEAVSPSSYDGGRDAGSKTWWKTFRSDSNQSAHYHSSGDVFGVPLSESIQYASVQISTAGKGGALYVWGVIPVVVAKCGLYLKENATEVEGTFRISGSAKRMRELQAVFDTGPKYGKNIDWRSLSYTSHDVATIFRRFLTQMPEPIIPLELYQDFRQTLEEDHEIEAKVTNYKRLIRAMPPINQYLLLYVLDLLHVFAKKSDQNLMTAANLALIFQPGVLSHPVHAMRPRDHVLSQQVLEFLIAHQDNFLIGMQLRKKDTPEPEEPAAPRARKADPDMMLPSDSDDEAPAGGYYVVESTPKQTASPKPLPEPRTISTPREPVGTTFDPSDSDSDAPPGGYEVREGDPAKYRASLLKGSEVPPESDLARRKTVPARLLGPARRNLRQRTRRAS